MRSISYITSDELEGFRIHDGHLLLVPPFPAQLHSEFVSKHLTEDAPYKVLQVGPSFLAELDNLKKGGRK